MAKKKENTENKEILEESKKAAGKDAAEETADENAQEKFHEKLKELLSLAKKKKNMLEYQEISDFFADMQLDAEQFEKILDFLEANNIDVLRITDDDVDDDIVARRSWARNENAMSTVADWNDKHEADGFMITEPFLASDELIDNLVK